MRNENFLILYDLRRYSHIEKNNTPEFTIKVLNTMHSIIENLLSKIGFVNYAIQTDNAIYISDDEEKSDLHLVLLKIKEEIDDLMQKYNYSSRLYICCLYGVLNKGEIVLKHKKHLNYFGQLMNELDQVEYLTINSKNKQLSEGIVFNENAIKRMNIDMVDSIICENKKIFYLKT